MDRTRRAILEAARELVAADGSGPSVGDIARKAGVSRLTVYSHFGSRGAVLGAIASPPPDAGALDLRTFFERSCLAWAGNPALFRNLHVEGTTDAPRRLAEQLAAADRLRPGCSLKEAEDVVAALSTFAVFDRLHKDGRRSAAAVTEILIRLAGGILA